MSELILANLIKAKLVDHANLDVLTFVSIDKTGAFQDEVRTYQQLWDNGHKLAQWLKGKGLKSGDRLAVVMANHPEFVDLMVASSILGAVFVPIDPRTKGDKLRYMLDFAECKAAIVADYALSNVEEVWSDRDDVWIASLEREVQGVNIGPKVAEELPIVSTDPDTPMQLLYTSGTTGDPKAIMSSHRRFGEIAGSISGILGLTGEDRPYTGLSLTHANAQVLTLGGALGGAMRAVISRKFTKSRLWDITRHYGCTFFNLLGGMTTAVYADPPTDKDADNPVRRILSAGMPAAIWEDFAKRFDVELFEFYGAAEGGLCFNPPSVGPVGSCGKAPPTLELKIFDENDKECEPGEAGEICFRNADGSAPIVKYFKNEEASEAKTRDGWLRMGDIGHVDENGWLFFHYRKGGGLRKNGDFINPAFVEKAFSEMATVNDVFVYGVPSSNGVPGEKDVVAAIVPSDPESFDTDSVFAEARQKLEANFVPIYLQVVDVIPKTASEKPLERFLLDAFEVDAKNIRKEG